MKEFDFEQDLDCEECGESYRLSFDSDTLVAIFCPFCGAESTGEHIDTIDDHDDGHDTTADNPDSDQ